jgi:hypothetical protein
MVGTGVALSLVWAISTVVDGLIVRWAHRVEEYQAGREPSGADDIDDAPAPDLPQVSGYWIAAGVFAGGAAGAVLYLLARSFRGREDAAIFEILTVGPPVILLLFTIVGVLQLGLMGIAFRDRRREWMARVGAWLIIYGLGWLALVGVAVYGPVALATGADWLRATVTFGWLATTVGGIMAARRTTSGRGGRGSRIAAGVAPYVFIFGLIAALALTLDWGLARATGDTRPGGYWPTFWATAQPEEDTVLEGQVADREGSVWSIALTQSSEQTMSRQFRDRNKAHLQLLLHQSEHIVTLLGLSLFAALALLLAWRVNINEFSMHRYYRNRLTRCYLGACNPGRRPHPFTGFDDGDDVPLAVITEDSKKAGSSYPFPIINTALNLVRGEELAWQERKAASFALTPLYCGFWLPADWGDRESDSAISRSTSAGPDTSGRGGFRPSDQYGGGVSLGTAMAISGAAASPNMGYHSTPALTFLMTTFNVRLGWWLGNPMSGAWKKPGPTFALEALLAELFGYTSASAKYVYLSDGGHFENLGIYELVRRRCRLIIASDAGADGDLSLDDLGNAIRKCRIDLATSIEFPVGALRKIQKRDKRKHSNVHVAVGTIAYPNAEAGTLLYIKSSLTGDEPADVLQYQADHPDFPHQSTADQWFDESQFESYRALGYHIGAEILAPASQDGLGRYEAFEKVVEGVTL